MRERMRERLTSQNYRMKLKVGNCQRETCKKEIYYKENKVLVSIVEKGVTKQYKFCSPVCLFEWLIIKFIDERIIKTIERVYNETKQ
jgi:hypothetical protein